MSCFYICRYRCEFESINTDRFRKNLLITVQKKKKGNQCSLQFSRVHERLKEMLLWRAIKKAS